MHRLDKQSKAEEEVDKFLQAGFIRKIMYPKWLENVVMVKKRNRKWRMCVNFINLNKACPKNCFPLSRIKQLVDKASGHQLLNFVDVFSG